MNENAPVDPDGHAIGENRGVVSDAETVSHYNAAADREEANHQDMPGEGDDHVESPPMREANDDNTDPEQSEAHGEATDASAADTRPEPDVRMLAQPQQQQQQHAQPPPSQAMFAYPPPSWPIPGVSQPHPSGIPQNSYPQYNQQQQQAPQPPGLLYYYEARMRDHAAAYASAAAGAAWVAAQIAANVGSGTSAPVPMMLPSPVFPPMPHPHMSPYGANQPFFDPSMQQPPLPILDPQQPAVGANPYYYYPSPPGGNQPYYGDESCNYVGSNNSITNNSMEDSASTESMNYNHHRRKRQQRMSPSETHQKYQRPTQQRIGHSEGSPMAQQQQHQSGAAEKRGRRRRRFRNDIGGSSGGDTDPNSSSYNNNARRHKTAKMKSLASSSSDGANSGTAGSTGGVGGGNQYHHHKKKQRQPSDESLLGKTGISALYEWCGKRRTTPTFSWVLHEEGDDEHENEGTALGNTNHEEFEWTVTVDGMEWGRGKGRTKSAARQEAARRALQLLLPGVVFDEVSGFVVELPSSSSYQQPEQWMHHLQKETNFPHQQEEDNDDEEEAHQVAATCALEELAPNLAKRLAIGPNKTRDEVGKQAKDFRVDIDYSKKRYKPSKQLPRVYPETSTTSEEEDKNTYFASRGASVCSALLHAMVQIDERIPEPPIYTYEVSTVPSNAASTVNNSQLKRKGGPASSTSPSYVPASTIVIHRGSFTCTASLKLVHLDSKVDMPESEEPGILRDDKDEQFESETLRAIGVGGTKREARHIASARLLALLFPECDGMVQVKQAAEAAREQYAASKAMKQRSQRERSFTDSVTTNQRFTNDTNHRSESPRGQKDLSFAMASSSDPPLPPAIAQHFQRLLGFNISLPKKAEDLDDNGSDQKDDPHDLDEGVFNSVPRREKHEGCLARQLSRQKQLDDKVAATLQKLNEHDEEGRSRPDEDDVGRTMLRRAGPEDVGWIVKLLGESTAGMKHDDDFEPSMLSPLSVIVPTEEEDDGSPLGKDDLHLWSSSTIVLLLCRAIAPFEDPPLGCAVLTLGFSMEQGRLLRIAQLASERHLPRERFIECLQSFACCLGYILETSTKASVKDAAISLRCLRTEEQEAIVDSYWSQSVDESTNRTKKLSPAATGVKDSGPRNYGEMVGGNISLPLQSVQEESDEENQSDAYLEKRNAKKVKDKPSKRSRVH
jgi:hypothetical protein